MEAADARGKLVGRAATTGVLDRLNGLANAIDRVANGVWKVLIKQQKLEDSVGTQVGRVDLAVSLKCRAATEQSYKFQILIAGVITFRLEQEMWLIHLQQSVDGVRTFQVAAEANEVPALPVDHRCVADTLEELNRIDNRRKYVVDVRSELLFSLRRMHLVIQAVQPLPLFAGNFFANLAGVFACCIDAASDGRGVVLVEDELLSGGSNVATPFETCRIAQCSNETLPVRFGACSAGIEHEAHGYIELAHGVLGALEVAAHPEEAVGNTRKQQGRHQKTKSDCYSRTHVSLLPPPCEELTTS